MKPDQPDALEAPKRGIARFLRGEVTDRFLGGAGFSTAAAVPITLDVKIGDQITRITDTIPAFTRTQPMTTTIPEGFSNFGRFVSDQVTAVTAVTPTITRTPDVIG